MWKRLSLFDKIWLGLTAAVLLGLFWVGIPHFRSACLLSRGVHALTAEGNTQAAIHHLESAVGVDPGNVQTYRWLAKAYLQTGDLDKALAAADSALSLAPDNPLAELELGDVYDQRGEAEKAIARYEPWGGEGREERLVVNYLMLADDLWSAGDREAAASIWEDKVVGRGFGDLYASWRLHQYYSDDQGRREYYRQRATYFPLESILPAVDPRLAPYRVQAMAGLVEDGVWERHTLLNAISYLVWQRHEGEAGLVVERMLLKLLEQWPRSADLHFYLAELYHRRGQLDRAEGLYHEVLALDARYAQSFLRLGMVTEARAGVLAADGPGALQESFEWYQRYNDLVPDDLLGLKRLVETAEALGYPQAEALRQELEAQTDDRLVVANLLEVAPESVELGPNLVRNGGFEAWNRGGPEGWFWSNMATGDPWNEGLFAGGKDELMGYAGSSARVDGLWLQQEKKEPGRAGWWHADSLALRQKDRPYLVSLSFRTEEVPESKATVYLTGQPNILWRGDRGLPATGGTWRHFLALGCSASGVETSIQPLIRLFSTGRLQFDEVHVRIVDSDGLQCGEKGQGVLLWNSD